MRKIKTIFPYLFFDILGINFCKTKFLSELPDLIIEQSAKNNPLGRNIYIDEVVPTIEYLLSSGSDMVTGQNIGVTGGVR